VSYDIAMSVRRGVVVVFILIGLAVMASVGMLVLFGMFSTPPTVVPQNSTLFLPIKAPLPEIEPANVFSQLVAQVPTLAQTIDAIHKAKRDSRVKALVFTPGTSGGLWGQVQELRLALEDFKSSGKTLTAYLEFGGAHEYYMASVADRVVLMPAGQLDLTGLATYELFLRGALDKLGASPDLLHIGDYKTAANTFTERGFTKAHREMSASLNRSWYDELVRAIATSRKKTVEEIRAAIDGGPYLPDGALKAGLVDRIAYEDQLDDEGVMKGTKRLDADSYARAVVSSPPRTPGARIAVLYATGGIASGKSSTDGSVTGSETFVEWLRKVRADSAVRAIVVRIDSPGGSAIASEVMWRELMLTRAVKPLIVSMGDVAASGGYYIAVPAHAIVAEPGTLTGSIGVVTGKFVVKDTLGKIGIGVDSVSDGQRAEIYSPFRPFTTDERARIEEQMQATYELFLSRVAEGRKSTKQKIDAVAQGRVWTGQQALERGLVDELGGLDRALRLAKEHAKLDVTKDVELAIYPQKPSLFELFSNPLGSGLNSGAAALTLFRRPETRALDAAAGVLTRFRRGEMLAVMPNVFVQ
jgi:protease IV